MTFFIYFLATCLLSLVFGNISYQGICWPIRFDTQVKIMAVGSVVDANAHESMK